MEIKNNFEPIFREIEIDGFAGNTAVGGENVNIVTRAFVTSDHPTFEMLANQVVNFSIGHSKDSVNKLLIVIKPDNQAKIYTNYPFAVNVKIKRPVKKGTIIFDQDIADIDSVAFDDMDGFDLDYEKGDKLIWLFRIRWKFGLYIDCSKELEKNEMLKELGDAYKMLKYYDLFGFLKDDANFISLINDGWFPFVELMSQKYKELLGYYAEEEKYSFRLDNLLDEYNEDRISKLSEKWWRCRFFNDKKEIIEAGLKAYCEGTDSGYINCIKNLSTELEGIIRTNFVDENQKKPTTQELKEFVVYKGKTKYSSEMSLLFPELFEKYLDDVLFKGFDLITGDLPSSRHVYAHGVATKSQYSRIKAFQFILSIDQIYYYLM